jgi:hypothetical protein
MNPPSFRERTRGRQRCHTFHQPLLAVSDFYHLPRIKMTYQRYGSEVYTVPCADTVPMSMPYNVARGVAAFWRYYLRRI